MIIAMQTNLVFDLFTVPAPNLFIQLNPIQLTFDPTTCLWFNRFLRSILENKVSNYIYDNYNNYIFTRLVVKIIFQYLK